MFLNNLTRYKYVFFLDFIINVFRNILNYNVNNNVKYTLNNKLYSEYNNITIRMKIHLNIINN